MKKLRRNLHIRKQTYIIKNHIVYKIQIIILSIKNKIKKKEKMTNPISKIVNQTNAPRYFIF